MKKTKHRSPLTPEEKQIVKLAVRELIAERVAERIIRRSLDVIAGKGCKVTTETRPA